ncbi:TonB-dependent siderophore receptor [Sphingomonas profundi]|uniref:TonB-dependent siderophore receptor n=1 Tax=Alterirhizorhabdus profundi TaxID=2681549 RepID=UPI0012E773CC|nr:TonB-dependent receptor [Sphingomonas profundi]
MTIKHLLLASAALGIAAPAFAQADPAASPPLRSDGTTPTAESQTAAEPAGEDIVVVGTAGGGTRRQDAAFAVTALSNDAIERAAPTSTADLLRTIPGVSAESSGGQNGANIFVRGYPSGGDAQFVTFQVAGVPVYPPPTLSFLENSQLIRLDETVERVEAVRGGTGSLFSSGQPGLTVNVVQREGGNELAGLAKISATDFGEVRGDGWISGPLGENTSFMVGGFYARSHGIRDPQFTVDKGGQITANIRHRFADDRGSVMVYGRYLNDFGQWLLPVPIVQNGKKISGFPGFDPGTGALASDDTRRTTINDGRTIDLADGRGARLFNAGGTFDYELVDGLRVRERATYLKGDADTTGLVPQGPPVTAAAYAASLGGTVSSLTFVNGGGAVPLSQQVIRAGVWQVRKDIKSFVNDLALEYEGGGNKLTGGFYYADYSSDDRWVLGNGLLLTAEENARRLNMTLSDGRIVTRDGFAQGATFNVNANYDGKDYAFYLVDEYQVTPELRVDGGIRYQKHKVTGRLENNSNGIDTDNNPLTLYNNGTAVLNGTFSTIDYSHGDWSWTAGVNYDFSRQVGAFARYSVGRSFPQFDNLREGLRITARVETYEGGLKLSSGIANAYLTVFHNKFDGLATTQLINDVPNAAVGGAKATGVELEGSVRPFDGFSVTAAGTYLDAKYRGFFTNNGLIDNTGNRVQRQPKWMWRVTPAYETEFGNLKPSIFATLQYTGDRFSDPENNQLLPNYLQLDAGIAVEINRAIRLQVTANNLTDEVGLTEGNPRIIGSQGSGVILARPILGRQFRFSASYSF